MATPLALLASCVGHLAARFAVLMASHMLVSKCFEGLALPTVTKSPTSFSMMNERGYVAASVISMSVRVNILISLGQVDVTASFQDCCNGLTLGGTLQSFYKLR